MTNDMIILRLIITYRSFVIDIQIPIAKGRKNALGQLQLSFLNYFSRSFEAIHKYLHELATVNKVRKVVFLRPEETRPKDNAKVISTHLVVLHLRDHVICEEDQ